MSDKYVNLYLNGIPKSYTRLEGEARVAYYSQLFDSMEGMLGCKLCRRHLVEYYVFLKEAINNSYFMFIPRVKAKKRLALLMQLISNLPRLKKLGKKQRKCLAFCVAYDYNINSKEQAEGFTDSELLGVVSKEVMALEYDAFRKTKAFAYKKKENHNIVKLFLQEKYRMEKQLKEAL